MDTGRLRFHLDQLAAIERSEAMMASCYLNLDDLEGFFASFSRAAREPGPAGEAVRRAQPNLQRLILADQGYPGLAFFHREGAEPWSMALRFRVPLPNRVSAGWLPAIYPLVEVADRLESHAVLLAGETGARILEVSYGEAGRDANVCCPEFRQRQGREWTKAHFLNHRRERLNQFHNQVVSVLERFLAENRLAKFVLAGKPKTTAGLREALPRGLACRLAGVVDVSAAAPLAEIIQRTQEAFIRAEEAESAEMAARFEREFHSGGLAVAGAAACLEALRKGRAGVLVLARDFDFGAVSVCDRCTAVFHGGLCRRCPLCQASIEEMDFREELARLAARSGCLIETISGCPALHALGGAGCLLHPRFMARPKRPAA